MKIIFILYLLYTAIFATSLENVWDIIITHNNAIAASTNELHATHLKQKALKSMYLPKISLHASYTHFSDPIRYQDKINLNNLPIPLGTIPIQKDLSNNSLFFANLRMLYPLYTGGAIDAIQDVYHAKSKEAHALLELQKDKIFLNLIHYYYGVITAKALYKTYLQTQKSLQAHYENAKKLKQHAQIATIELLNAQAKFDISKIETLKAKHKVEIAQLALDSLAQRHVEVDGSLFIDALIQKQTYYTTHTKEKTHTLDLFDAKSSQADALISIQKSKWHPKIVSYANYNLYKDNSILSNSLPKWFAGIMLQFDIVSRDDRNQQIEASKLLNTKIHNLKKESLNKLLLLTKKTYKELQSAKEEFYALQSSISLAKENYRLRSIAFNEGLSTSTALIDAQSFLESIETKRLYSAYLYIEKLAQLCVLSGERELFFKIAHNTKEIK